MKKVGILSDTHGFLNPVLIDFFKDCDEIWHGGDWGDIETFRQLNQFKPLRTVWGNIDGRELRMEMPEVNFFAVEELSVCIIHIGGYPGKYSPGCKKMLSQYKPDILVCGHSHILKVMKDKTLNTMVFNPGAAGIKGFHQVCTALRLKIDGKRMFDLEVWEVPRNQVLVQPIT
jgi:putative phosphoesterase